jgi:hypothetical protein
MTHLREENKAISHGQFSPAVEAKRKAEKAIFPFKKRGRNSPLRQRIEPLNTWKSLELRYKFTMPLGGNWLLMILRAYFVWTYDNVRFHIDC